MSVCAGIFPVLLRERFLAPTRLLGVEAAHATGDGAISGERYSSK